MPERVPDRCSPSVRGLSYTRFRYSSLRASAGRSPKIDLVVTNTGRRPGIAKPQVYMRPPGRSPRLVGWARAKLRTGETRHVQVLVDPRLLARYDTVTRAWVRPEGRYLVTAGASAVDLPLQTTMTLAADERRER